MSIEVTLLGTGNPLPDASRAGSATLVRAGSQLLLFDAGRGVLLRMTAAGVLPVQLAAAFVTHLHSDHICDLNDVITTRWVMGMGPNPLTIIGPGRTREVVDGILTMLGPDIEYRLAHHEDLNWGPDPDVSEVVDGVVFEADGVRVRAEPTDHRPVEPTVGFRVEHEDGVVVIGGDGVPCAGLDRLCDGADVYVQTVLRPDLVEMVPMQRFKDTIDYHSSVTQAADTAQRAGVKTLVLTHQVPTPAAGSEEEWRAIAAEVFAGQIVVGDDLTVVTT